MYGKGGQTRGYINIKDTLNCVRLSLENPAQKGELRVFNQFTETFSVNDLAAKVQTAGKMLGLDVQIKSIENPRKELEEHYYNPKHTGLLDLGLVLNLLSEDVITKMLEQALDYKASIAYHKIFRCTKWV